MNRNTLRYILPLLFVAVLLTACGERKVAVTEDAAEIKFDTLSHDFGTIPPDTRVSYDFVFHNIGSTYLHLEDIKPTCSCTAAKYPKGGIEPGETAAITITYDSHGSSPGHFSRSIRVYSNAKTSFLRLNVSGEVGE